MATESNHTPFDDVKLFMDVCGDITTFDEMLAPNYEAAVNAMPSEKVQPHLDQIERYVDLIDEEIQELKDSNSREDLLDAIMDSIFVLIGLGTTMGFPMNQAWEEICRSNMTKIDPKTGKVLRRESDGKILKPEGYSPPDLKKILNVHYAEKKHLQAV